MLDREQLVGALVRLRRSLRRRPDDEDVAAVCRDLEQAAGATIGRAAAARLLGISQTALDRWIASGEVPVVLTPGGRRELPLPAFVELLEAVERERAAGERRHPLAAVLRERRARAAALESSTLLPHDVRRGEPEGSHREADLRALAYHRAVARRLDDQVVAHALRRLRRWRREGRIHPRYADAWDELLIGPRSHLVRLIGIDDEHAQALRQSSPLAGVLDESERHRVLALVAEATR